MNILKLIKKHPFISFLLFLLFIYIITSIFTLIIGIVIIFAVILFIILQKRVSKDDTPDLDIMKIELKKPQNILLFDENGKNIDNLIKIYNILTFYNTMLNKINNIKDNIIELDPIIDDLSIHDIFNGPVDKLSDDNIDKIMVGLKQYQNKIIDKFAKKNDKNNIIKRNIQITENIKKIVITNSN